MNYRIKFADGTIFPCATTTINPVRHTHTSDRDYRKFTLIATYADVLAKFVNGAQYAYEWDSFSGEETVVTSEDCSAYNIAAEIVDTRDGNITIWMSKPTETEVLEDVTKTLVGTVVTKEKAIALRTVIETAVSSLMLTDAEALACAELFPAWESGISYTVGTRLIYNGVLYSVLQAHTSQADWTPDVAVSLFAQVLIPDPEVIPEWAQPESTNPYRLNDKVTHNGKTWVSNHDANVWEPGAEGVYTWDEVV